MKKIALFFFVFLCFLKANAGCAFEGYHLRFLFTTKDSSIYSTDINVDGSCSFEQEKELILDTIEVAESDALILNVSIQCSYFYPRPPHYDTISVKLLKDTTNEYLGACDWYIEHQTYSITRQNEYQKFKLYSPYGNTIVIHFKPATPSPSFNTFTLTINNSLIKFNTEEQQFNLKIINLSGYKVHEQSIENAEKVVLDGDIPSGIYILVLSNGKSNYTKKIFL